MNRTVFWIINNIFFQYYKLLIFLISFTIIIVVSYMTKASAYEQLNEPTYSTVTKGYKKELRTSRNKKDEIASGVILLLILLANIYFPV